MMVGVGVPGEVVNNRAVNLLFGRARRRVMARLPRFSWHPHDHQPAAFSNGSSLAAIIMPLMAPPPRRYGEPRDISGHDTLDSERLRGMNFEFSSLRPAGATGGPFLCFHVTSRGGIRLPWHGLEDVPRRKPQYLTCDNECVRQ